jgi:hypothetical protein
MKFKEVVVAYFKVQSPSCAWRKQEILQKFSIYIRKIHLDRRLTCAKHVKSKRKQLNLPWLLGRRSTLSTQSNVLLYKAVIRAIWTCGIQLWETASNSKIEVLQRFQSKKDLRSMKIYK